MLPNNCPGCLEPIWIWNKVGESEDKGYSITKGALGAALLGPVGAIAGVGGKKNKTVTYSCPHCGYKITVKE